MRFCCTAKVSAKDVPFANIIAGFRAAAHTWAMSLHWSISRPNRMVIAVARDEVSAREIDRYMEAVAADGASSYRKIFDITHMTSRLDDEALRALGETARRQAAKTTLGPIAIVARSDEGFRQATVYAEAATAARPLRIFRELHEARRWLDSIEQRSADSRPQSAAF
jgi:hypothetical protein